MKEADFFRRAYQTKSLWLALTLSCGVSIIFSFIILREFFFSPGLIQYGDLHFHANLKIETSLLESTWSSYMSNDNAEFISTYPIYQFLSLLGNSYIAQRFLLASVFTVTGINMYTTFFAFIRRSTKPIFSYTVPLIPTILYVLNPFTATRMPIWTFLWGYAFTPLLFYITMTGMEKKTLKELIKSACGLSIIFSVAGISVHNIVFSFLFVGVLVLMEIVFSLRKNVFEKLRRGSVILGLTVILYLLLASYWIIPWFFSYRILASRWELPLTLQRLEQLNRDAIIFNVFRTLGDRSDFLSEFFKTTNTIVGEFSTQHPIYIILTTLLPIMALLPILIKPKIYVIKDKYIYVITVVALIFIFLAKGPNPPFGDLYKWLLFDTPIRNVNWIVKSSATLQWYLEFCYAFLIGALTVRLVSVASPHIRGKIILSMICLSLIVTSTSAYPLLTGNISGVASPIEIPKDYKTLNDWLESRHGDFRVAWLPSGPFPVYLNVNWAPHGELTPHPSRWVSEKPVFSFAPYQNKMIYYLMKDLLLHNKTSYIGKLFSFVGVKYIVFQNNTENPEEYKQILDSLYRQKDLRLIRIVGDLLVFENMEEVTYSYATEDIVLSVSGLDVLPYIMETDSFSPNTTSIIFVEQYGLKLETIEELSSTYHTTLLFYGIKNLDDLALSTLSDDYFSKPYEITLKQPSYWRKDFMSSRVWIPYYMNELHSYVGHRYDFDMNKGILVYWPPSNTKGENVTIPIRVVKTGRNQLWIRTLISPHCGKLKLFLDGEKLATVNTKSKSLEGFKWQEVAEVFFNHTGVYKLTINSGEGFSAINLIATVPSTILESQKERIQKIMENSDIKVIHLIGTEGNNHLLVSGEESDPIQGLNLPLVNYRKVEQTKFFVKVNSSRPFILIHNEAYNGHWRSKAHGAKIIESFPVNFFANGLAVKPSENAITIEIEYLPEKYFNIGKQISFSSLSIFIGLLILTKARHKKDPSKKG